MPTGPSELHYACARPNIGARDPGAEGGGCCAVEALQGPAHGGEPHDLRQGKLSLSAKRRYAPLQRQADR